MKTFNDIQWKHNKGLCTQDFAAMSVSTQCKFCLISWDLHDTHCYSKNISPQPIDGGLNHVIYFDQ